MVYDSIENDSDGMLTIIGAASVAASAIIALVPWRRKQEKERFADRKPDNLVTCYWKNHVR